MLGSEAGGTYSFVAPNLQDSIGKWDKRDFARTLEQNAALNLAAADGESARCLKERRDPRERDLQLPTSCPDCMDSHSHKTRALLLVKVCFQLPP